MSRLSWWGIPMHREFDDVLKDPFFWAAMLAIVLPFVFIGAMLVWWY